VVKLSEESKARIHIPLGNIPVAEITVAVSMFVGMWLAVLTATCFSASEADAQEMMFHRAYQIIEEVTAPPKLVLIANTKDGHYATKLLAENSSSSPASFDLHQAGCLTLPFGNVPANGAGAADTAGKFCSDFVLSDPGALEVRSVIHFNDGRGESSLVVPPIGAVTFERPSNFIGPVINDGEMNAYLAFIASERSAVTLTFYDGSRKQIGIDATDVPAGVSLYKVPLKFPVGYISIALGFTQFGLYPSKAPLYGFVSNATERNGNSIIYPMGQ
jgi:hypothetical protein